MTLLLRQASFFSVAVWFWICACLGAVWARISPVCPPAPARSLVIQGKTPLATRSPSEAPAVSTVVLQGTVLDFWECPAEGWRIRACGVETVSDAMGRFEARVPSDQASWLEVDWPLDRPRSVRLATVFQVDPRRSLDPVFVRLPRFPDLHVRFVAGLSAGGTFLLELEGPMSLSVGRLDSVTFQDIAPGRYEWWLTWTPSDEQAITLESGSVSVDADFDEPVSLWVFPPAPGLFTVTAQRAHVEDFDAVELTLFPASGEPIHRRFDIPERGRHMRWTIHAPPGRYEFDLFGMNGSTETRLRAREKSIELAPGAEGTIVLR